MTGPSRIIALAALATLLTACGADSDNAATASNNVDANTSVTDAGVLNIVTTDMGLPNNNQQTEDMGTTTPEPDAGEMEDMPEPGPMPVEVQWPATPDEFIATATDVSVVNSLEVPVPDANGYPTCCRDFGDKSKRPGPDNAFGSLLQQIISLEPDASIANLLNDSVQQGRIVLLLDHRAYEGPEDSDGYALSWLDGAWTDGTAWDGVAAGQASFLVDRESFIPGSGEPRVVMNPTVVRDGVAEGGPATLRLLVPVGFALIPATIHDARIRGQVRDGDGGVGYSEGQLSGYARTEEMFRALNEIVGANCECLGLDRPFDLYSESATGNWSGSCTPMAHVQCIQPEEEVCRVLAGAKVIDGGFCGVLPQILQNTADIDADGDGRFESLSLGAEWTAVPAQLQ